MVEISHRKARLQRDIVHSFLQKMYNKHLSVAATPLISNRKYARGNVLASRVSFFLFIMGRDWVAAIVNRCPLPNFFFSRFI